MINVVYDITIRIDAHLNEVSQFFTSVTEDELSKKPAPGKWSKKEILGHLCDSAVNNLARFLRIQYEAEPFVINTYQQDEWVKANHYNEIKKEDLLNLWITLNRQINHVLLKMPEGKLAAVCDYNGGAFGDPGDNNSLLWFINDYLEHMEHHLLQLGIKN